MTLCFSFKMAHSNRKPKKTQATIPSSPQTETSAKALDKFAEESLAKVTIDIDEGAEVADPP